MKRLLVPAATGVLIALAMSMTALAQSSNLINGKAKAGKAKAATCAGCHGADGNSAQGQYPKLAGQSATYLHEQLMYFKSGKRKNAVMNGMVSSLSSDDMKNLAAYFSQQQMALGVADPKLVQRGRKLFRAGDAQAGIPACSGCHGPTGMGNPAAAFPRISSQHTQYIATQLKAYRSGKRDYAKGQIMQGVVKNLTDKDIQALASYVSGLHPPGAGGGQKTSSASASQ